MILRYRPDVWWWGVVFLFRSVLVTFGVTLDPSRPFIQMMFIICILIAYLFVQSMYWPWRTPGLNLLDAISGACLIGIVAASMPFAIQPDAETIDMAKVCVIVLYVICVGTIGIYFLFATANWVLGVCFPKRLRKEANKNEIIALDLVSDMEFMLKG